MTDAQWAVLEPLLPPPGNTTGRGGRPEKHPRRMVLDAIFYLVTGGIAWAALPHDFPPHQTVYGLFRRWARAGAWARVHDALRDLVRVYEGRDPAPTAAIIDSASVRGADTVPTRTRGYDAGKKVNGRKRHIAVDTGGLLLAVVVTIAGIQDRDGVHRLLTVLRARFSTIRHIWADGGYAGRLVRWASSVLSFGVEVVKRTDNLAGFQVLPRRWVVERTLVRREALCCIPGSAGRDLEGGSWVEWLTWIRKVKGDKSMPENPAAGPSTATAVRRVVRG